MFIDSQELPDGTIISGDLIIIGGGIAGLALAREWAGSNRRVVVLESGGEEQSGSTQDLYAGKAQVRGPDNPDEPIDDYLIDSRFRYLGGSGNAWGGKCVPLDDGDFVPREWVERSGWPITREELQPFYNRASALLNIPRFDLDFTKPQLDGRPPYTIAGGARFTNLPRYFTKYTGRGFGSAYKEYKSKPAQADNVTVYLNANVTDIKLDRETGKVEQLKVKCLNGRSHSAVATAYVLACGGIENARLLLLSNSINPAGVGNETDHVGRYFMGHVTLDSYDRNTGAATAIFVTQPTASLSLYTDRSPGDGWHCVFGATLAGQRHYQIPNFTITMSGGGPNLTDDMRAIGQTAALVDQAGAADGTKAAQLVWIYYMAEQLSNPESRVSLLDKQDALGCARTRLDWVYSDRDWEMVERSVDAFCAELGAAGMGRASWPVKRSEIISVMGRARHHMGTTRMDPDPAKGVVDADCKVHGVDNLYIAGSSVFPTSGIANPTYTILALVMRLSDHLKSKLGASQ